MPDGDFFLAKCFLQIQFYFFPEGHIKMGRHFNYDQFIVFCVVAIFPQMSFMGCRM